MYKYFLMILMMTVPVFSSRTHYSMFRTDQLVMRSLTEAGRGQSGVNIKYKPCSSVCSSQPLPPAFVWSYNLNVFWDTKYLKWVKLKWPPVNCLVLFASCPVPALAGIWAGHRNRNVNTEHRPTSGPGPHHHHEASSGPGSLGRYSLSPGVGWADSSCKRHFYCIIIPSICLCSMNVLKLSSSQKPHCTAELESSVPWPWWWDIYCWGPASSLVWPECPRVMTSGVMEMWYQQQ